MCHFFFPILSPFPFLRFESSLWAQGCSVQTSNFKAFSRTGLVPRWYLGFREVWIAGLCCTSAKKLNFSMENWLCMCNFVSEYNLQVRINHEAHLGFEGAQGILCARENPFWGKKQEISLSWAKLLLRMRDKANILFKSALRIVNKISTPSDKTRLNIQPHLAYPESKIIYI